MRATDGLFLGGLLLFLAGAAVIVRALSVGGPLPLWPGIVALVAAVACLGAGAWIRYRRVDWRRIESEQRLWESGPVGRLWLRLRRRLTGD